MSFKQDKIAKISTLSRCAVCRRSHSKGINHVYAAGHIKNLRRMLSKFCIKIKDAVPCLDNPLIIRDDSSDRQHVRFWCHFCLKEIVRHLYFDNQFYLENAGLLEHIASTRHLLLTKAFWRNNRIRTRDKTHSHSKAVRTSANTDAGQQHVGKSILKDYYAAMHKNSQSDVDSSVGLKKWLKSRTELTDNAGKTCLRQSAVSNGKESDEKSPSCTTVANSSFDWTVESFVVTKLDFERFKNRAKQCIDRHFIVRDTILNQEASRIANCTMSRVHMTDYFRKQMSSYKDPGSRGNQPQHLKSKNAVNTGGPNTPGAVRTVGAFGEGLTYIGVPKHDDTIGNVYSDAPPPWLQTSTEKTDGSSSAVIGPTADDLRKHLERQKKLKLPATRVGADFNRQNGATDASDLPSFGGVWSKNRRSQQQARFKKVYFQRGGGRRTAGLNGGSLSTSQVALPGGGVGDDCESADHQAAADRMSIVQRDVNEMLSNTRQNTPSTSDIAMLRPGVYQRKRPAVATQTSQNSGVVNSGRLNLASNLL